MTGTAIASAGQLRQIYRCHVLQIPTNRPCIRQRMPDHVFGTADTKWDAVAEEISPSACRGPPRADWHPFDRQIGAPLALLTSLGIEHQILNANHIEEEADIIAAAGLLGRVTVSTNMAGRGTDISLGKG